MTDPLELDADQYERWLRYHPRGRATPRGIALREGNLPIGVGAEIRDMDDGMYVRAAKDLTSGFDDYAEESEEIAADLADPYGYRHFFGLSGPPSNPPPPGNVNASMYAASPATMTKALKALYDELASSVSTVWVMPAVIRPILRNNFGGVIVSQISWSSGPLGPLVDPRLSAVLDKLAVSSGIGPKPSPVHGWLAVSDPQMLTPLVEGVMGAGPIAELEPESALRPFIVDQLTEETEQATVRAMQRRWWGYDPHAFADPDQQCPIHGRTMYGGVCRSCKR